MMNPAPFIYAAFGIGALVLIGYMGLQLRMYHRNHLLLLLLTQGAPHAK